jgi:hypothetical protein
MFQKLKTKNVTVSKFRNMFDPTNFSKSPGTSFSEVKGNEGDRKVRCQHCGWICDRERDVRMDNGSWAGFGIQQGQQLTAGTSVGDSKAPAAGSVSGTPDKYHDRTLVGGCPCCGSYVYDGNVSPKMGDAIFKVF